MKYSIGQYTKTEYSIDNQYFLTLYPDVENVGYFIQDLISETTEDNRHFPDPYLKPKNTFDLRNKYYVHLHILALPTAQNFNVVLMNFNKSTGEYEEQLVHNFRINAREGYPWVNIEFNFKPYKEFEYLCLQLQRGQNDYFGGKARIPVVKFLELSKIEDILHTANIPAINIQSKEDIIKIGVHANPGFKMYINNSELMVGKSGIYELHNPIIVINSFSVLAPLEVLNKEELADEELQISNNYQTNVLNKDEINALIEIGFEKDGTGKINSHFSTNPSIYSTYDTSKLNKSDSTKRAIPAFTLDFVKKYDDGEIVD